MASEDINPLWLAQSRLRRRRYDECTDLCTAALQQNPLDQVAWYLKCRAVTLKAWVDDTDLEEEAIGDALMDEHHVAQAARPGTSLARPATGTATQDTGASANGFAWSTPHACQQGSASPAVRPMSAAGRPLSGYVRPSTGAARPGTGSTANPRTALTTALKAARPGTGVNRPVTSAGRCVRLGAASMASCGAAGGPFIKPERLDMRKYASRPNLARVLCDYIIYADGNMTKALELASHAASQSGDDWWWQERLGKAYYQLGLLRDADKHFAAAADLQDMLVLTHQRAKVCLRMDQPLAALQLYSQAADKHPADMGLLLGQARIQEAVGQHLQALALYQQVLALDGSCAEAIACLAAEHFYGDQPELSIRYYRRLLQMGEASPEVWTNLGLSCFYAGQYDLCFSCFQRGLVQADDTVLPDIWYNIGQVAIGIGQLSWAEQCFRLVVALDPSHGEAINNLSVLESKKGLVQQAAARLQTGMGKCGHVFELHYNAALLAHRQGDLQEALSQVSKALELYPQHADSLELKKQLRTQLMAC